MVICMSNGASIVSDLLIYSRTGGEECVAQLMTPSVTKLLIATIKVKPLKLSYSQMDFCKLHPHGTVICVGESFSQSGLQVIDKLCQSECKYDRDSSL